MNRQAHTLSAYAKAALIAGAVAVSMLAVWGWQQAHSFFAKGVAEGKSIRISERTACALPSVAKGQSEPHFSGCNSIL